MSSLERPTGRINNFSDGVFGVAATALILPVIDVIREAVKDDQRLGGLISDLWRPLLFWLLSVVVVGTFWIAHHNILHLVKKWDRWFLWVNTGFLMSVTFLPVPLAILANYSQPLAVAGYGIALVVSSLWLLAVWEYLSRHHDLLWHDVNPDLFKPVRRQILLAPAVYGIASVAAWVMEGRVPPGSGMIWLPLIPIAALQVRYMLPGNIDRDAQRRSAQPIASAGE